ncbi:hypothetical protein [Frankia sp. Cr1]|uniref:hypothetical protein n=1 Tax=Frankia sp. Cr1 TaxID=3073931 RepID=UPI002AD23F8D|nr:hypothetical protein [Frankia sp. Cr1]
MRDSAARLAAQAVFHLSSRPAAGHDVAGQAAGIGLLLTVAHRHARFLARPFPADLPPRRFADHLTRVAPAARELLADARSGPSDLWRQAADTLAVAHDLLAAQVGPSGEPRGPDAPALTLPAAVNAATARLAGITLTAAVSANNLANRIIRSAAAADLGPTTTASAGAARTADALLELGGLVTVCHIHHQEFSAGTMLALNDVTPLLGDAASSPLERALEHLRLEAYQMSHPDAAVSHHALITLADLSAKIAGRAQTLASLTTRLGRADNPIDHHRLAANAAQATAAYQNLSRHLRVLDSTGSQGQPVRHAAYDVARWLETATAPALHGDLRSLPNAVAAIRRAVLILPDLASTGLLTADSMTGKNLLHRRTATGHFAPIGTETSTALRRGYTTALDSSRLTLASYLALDSSQPLPGRAEYLTRYRPVRTLPTTSVASPPQNPTPASREAVRLESLPNGTRIHDPYHGVLEVPSATFAAALTQPSETLRNILRIRVGSHLTGDESLITLAALTAARAPDTLVGLPVPPTGPVAHSVPSGAPKPPSEPTPTPPLQLDLGP